MKREKSPSSEACATDLTVILGSWAFLSSSVSSMVLNCPRAPRSDSDFASAFSAFSDLLRQRCAERAGAEPHTLQSLSKLGLQASVGVELLAAYLESRFPPGRLEVWMMFQGASASADPVRQSV